MFMCLTNFAVFLRSGSLQGTSNYNLLLSKPLRLPSRNTNFQTFQAQQPTANIKWSSNQHAVFRPTTTTSPKDLPLSGIAFFPSHVYHNGALHSCQNVINVDTWVSCYLRNLMTNYCYDVDQILARLLAHLTGVLCTRNRDRR